MSRLTAVAAATFVALAHPPAARAQSAAGPLPVVNTPERPQSTGSQQQLLPLVAPVALYPDPVLTDILAAATYPTQIVEAERFATDPANAGLQSDALMAAAAGHNWDPSVTALLAFPQILQMMDARLEWTEQLGHAFVAQQADIMGAIQTLRLQAQAAGILNNGPQDIVVNDGSDIAIIPPSQEVVYLPAYNPDCVYGPTPDCTADQANIGWDDAVVLPFGFVQWGLLDWAGRDIRLGYFGSSHDSARGLNTAASAKIWRHPSVSLFAGYHQPGLGAHDDATSPARQFEAFTGAYGHSVSTPHIALTPVFRAGPLVHAPVPRASMRVTIMRGGPVGRR